MSHRLDSTRRSVLGAALSTLGLALAPAPLPGWAAQLSRTPRQSQGPFYPGGELLARFDIVRAADGRLGRPPPAYERLLD